MHGRVLELLVGLASVFRIERLNLSLSVEKVRCVTRLTSLRNTKTTLELASSSASVDVLRSRDHNLLLFVVVSSTFSFVLGFLDSGLLVAFVQVEDDVGVQGLNLLLQVGYRLDPIHRKDKVSG